MISFRLRCAGGHEFEGWFRSSDDYQSQHDRGLLSCPICENTEIAKAVMAPAVARRDREVAQEVLPPQPQEQAPAVPPPSPEKMAQMMVAMRKIKDHVEANFENVGEKFPEEARKIHYGEREAKGIMGKANLEEAKELIEEGVSVMPLPDLPDLDS